MREALNADLYPIFVAEGESKKKLERIRHSDFLYRSLRSFREIGGTCSSTATRSRTTMTTSFA